MDYPPIPANEGARLAALRRYDILTAPVDLTLERIAAAAAALFDTSIGIINLVDELRGHFAAVHGAEMEGADRADMICSSVIMQDEVVVYEDARIDPYTSTIPGVHAMGVVFYAAAPLHTRDGYNLGTLCVLDTTPRSVTDKQKELLAGLAAVVIDEMELRLAARQLGEAQTELRLVNAELEAANRNKSAFLAHMSHELRTPLNAILGASELLGDGLFGELNSRQSEYVTDIHQSGQHLLSLINDVLDLAKIESGHVELELEALGVASLMERCAAAVRGQAAAKEIAFALHAPAESIQMGADERALKQILYNLLSNAVKFTPPGGSVSFRGSQTGGGMEFAVTDTGSGIPADQRDRVFDEFVQLPGTKEGTGLGLSIAKRLVELHGGTLTLTGGGGGSTFTVFIPAA